MLRLSLVTCYTNTFISSITPSYAVIRFLSAFIGVCIDRNIQCGNKVVWRANKTEKVGVTASIDGHMGVLEYSEIPIHLAEAEDETGKLVFGAANICNHYLTVSFLLETVLPNMGASYHLATKKIPCLDVTTGHTSTPCQPNGKLLRAIDATPALFLFSRETTHHY